MIAGRLDVDAMLSELDGVLCSEWMAFLGLHVSDARFGAAQVCSTLANVMGSGTRTFTPADFLPAQPAEEQDPEIIKALIMGCVPEEEE